MPKHHATVSHPDKECPANRFGIKSALPCPNVYGTSSMYRRLHYNWHVKILHQLVVLLARRLHTCIVSHHSYTGCPLWSCYNDLVHYNIVSFLMTGVHMSSGYDKAVQIWMVSSYHVIKSVCSCVWFSTRSSSLCNSSHISFIRWFLLPLTTLLSVRYLGLRVSTDTHCQ